VKAERHRHRDGGHNGAGGRIIGQRCRVSCREHADYVPNRLAASVPVKAEPSDIDTRQPPQLYRRPALSNRDAASLAVNTPTTVPAGVPVKAEAAEVAAD
jgi:hypothetical protein